MTYINHKRRDRSTRQRYSVRLFAAVWAVTGGAVVAVAGGADVFVTSVAGEWVDAKADVVWTVAGGQEIFGFQVYRVETSGPVLLDGSPVRFNGFEPGESVCRLADLSQARGEEATYRIDALRVDGTVETVGSWTISFDEPPSAAMMKALTLDDPNAAALASSIGPALKVPVESNDLFRVSFADIAGGLGWTESAVSNAVVSTNLAMRCGDVPVAYLADFLNQQIVFYGWPATNRYTHTGFFWIEPGSGVQMQRRNPDSTAAASNLTFSSSVPFEEDVSSMVEFGLLRDDLYFWEFVQAGSSSVGTRVFDVSFDGYAGGNVTFTVRLVGFDDNPTVSDHLAEIWLNSYKLGEMAFDGKADVSVTVAADAGMLLPSGNQLKVTGILQPGVTVSRFIVDDFKVDYQRFYEPFAGLLLAHEGESGRLSADTFLNAMALDVTNPYEPVWIADPNGVIPFGWSWEAEPSTRWAMSEWGRLSAVSPQPAGFGAWLRDATNALDYLVIAPRAFEAPAQDLADYRATQGLRTAVALYEDICDQFSGGLNTPEAIRECLAYAHLNWKSAPDMVVLGGWGHFDYLGAQTTATNFIPALLGSDSRSLRPADALLADITGGDEVPDLSIGRIPVQSVTQFNAYIAKLQAYEAAGPQSGHAQMLFVADNIDDGGGLYGDQCRAVRGNGCPLHESFHDAGFEYDI